MYIHIHIYTRATYIYARVFFHSSTFSIIFWYVEAPGHLASLPSLPD